WAGLRLRSGAIADWRVCGRSWSLPHAHIGLEPLLNLGIGYLLKHRYEDAVKLLEAARVRYPAYPTFDFPLAGAYAELGRTEAAKDALEQGRRKDPYLDLEGFGTRFRD